MSCSQAFIVNEASAFSVMYRVYVDGVAMVQADVTSIEYAVLNDGTKEVITALSPLTVANVVFDTLQTTSDDARWVKDNVGYNFRHDVAHTVTTDPDITYRLEYKVTLSGGSEFWLDPITINLNEMYSN